MVAVEVAAPLCVLFRSVRVAVAETPLSAAVITAACVPENAPATALNEAPVEPDGTVTAPGTVSDELLLCSETATPLPLAAAFRLTVQLLVWPGPNRTGLQLIPERTPGAFAVRAIVALCELAPDVAVTLAFWLFGIAVPAVALKVPLLAPAAIVTEPGTVSRPLLLVTVTLVPPAGAAELRPTTHVLAPPAARLAGLHVSEETSAAGAAVSASVAVCETPPKFADTTAF